MQDLRAGDDRPLDRREFLRVAAGSASALAAGGLALACERSPIEVEPEDDAALRLPESLSVLEASLLAAPGTVLLGGARAAPAWLFNGLMPGPTLRARRGENARITLLNHLPEETIVHWHGLIVPEEADGHPRYAVPPGARYEYAFPVLQRAGTFWYHPHAHHRTAFQTYSGLAGFFIVSDPEEDALRLPGGAREVLLMLQDRRLAAGSGFAYLPADGDLATGLLGDVVFGNGVPGARLRVSADTYRFRVLNASNARVFRLALSTGAPLTVIGNDGGLLPAAAQVESVYLGVGERADLLIDFSALPPGSRLALKSLPFDTFGPPGERFLQGTELDVLELEVSGPRRFEAVVLPPALSDVPRLPPADAVRERTFEFRSSGGSHHVAHRINGREFDMWRVDEQVPLGQLERWVFRNDSALPHPVHLHGTHFQVLSRSGGRGTVYPCEGGWKDTVLLLPLEEVEVLVRFDAYRGVFPLHCHILEHEDTGMMLNVEVV
jgi:FtsP/CotA-like multicopper oxidase with cupredoxin domain